MVDLLVGGNRKGSSNVTPRLLPLVPMGDDVRVCGVSLNMCLTVDSIVKHGRSVLFDTYAETPMVVPTWMSRGSGTSPIRIKRMMKGDFYIGRGTKQRRLTCSRYRNNFKVAITLRPDL